MHVHMNLNSLPQFHQSNTIINQYILFAVFVHSQNGKNTQVGIITRHIYENPQNHDHLIQEQKMIKGPHLQHYCCSTCYIS
nr:hypothetical protein Iba_chr02bCG24590 [Ipomoea batatas]